MNKQFASSECPVLAQGNGVTKNDDLVFDTLILSDVHLGSDISRSNELFGLLSRSNFKKLILLGDIFADLNFKRLSYDHWQVLNYILRLPHERQVEVVWIEGNHDLGLSEVFSQLFGIRVHHEYSWLQNGKQHIALHGHQFDRFVYENPGLSRILSAISLLIEKIDTSSKVVTRTIHRLVHTFQKITPKVALGASRMAQERNAHIVFCGHTHEALHIPFENVDYYNTGSWVSSPSTYVGINSDGIRLLTHH